MDEAKNCSSNIAGMKRFQLSSTLFSTQQTKMGKYYNFIRIKSTKVVGYKHLHFMIDIRYMGHITCQSYYSHIRKLFLLKATSKHTICVIQLDSKIPTT